MQIIPDPLYIHFLQFFTMTRNSTLIRIFKKLRISNKLRTSTTNSLATPTIKLFKATSLILIAVLWTAVLTSSCNSSQPTAKLPETPENFGSIERIDSSISTIISPDAKVEIVAEGFEWSEGPVWIPSHNMLLFSDIPPNSIYKWTEEKGKELYLKPSGYTGSAPWTGGEPGSNGLLLDDEGNLILCQHGDRRIAMMNAPIDSPKAEFVTVADNYNGKRFDSPNDAVRRSDGSIFFTDPPYGLPNYTDDSTKDAPYQGVYKVDPEGKVTLLVDSIYRPNGIAFLPGEKTLLVADSERAKWYAYDFDENDSLVNGRIFYDATEASKTDKGGPDGMKVDNNGNVYATGPGGIWIFDKNAKVLGKIKVPVATSNVALADDDKTLYITADMYLLRVKLR